MPLPNFLIIGTRKAGTTSLYHYLHQHPEIYMTPEKGTRFFLCETEKQRKEKNLPAKTLTEYSKLFNGAEKKEAKAIGEVSPTYMYSKKACLEIKETIPNVKLIASLRNPVDMTYSYYQMQMRQLKPKDQIPIGSDNVSRWSGLGLYYSNLKNYFDCFDHERIKIIIFEEWIKDPLPILQDIFRFLEVDEKFIPNMEMKYNIGGVAKNRYVAFLLRHKKSLNIFKPIIPENAKMAFNKVINKNMKKLPPLDPAIRNQLNTFFRQDILLLQDQINKDLSAWLGESN